MRVEVEIREGRKRSTTSFEGDLCRERATRLLEALDELEPEPEARDRRINVEIEEDGGRTSMRFEGGLCRERAVRYIKAHKASSEPQESKQKTADSRGLSASKVDEDLTLKERLRLFLKFDYNDRWFSSRGAKRAYERAYGEDIGLSTVSTYLSRMYREGFLERRGSRAEREYRVAVTPENGPTGGGEAAESP